MLPLRQNNFSMWLVEGSKHKQPTAQADTADTGEGRFSEIPVNSERSLERYTIHIPQTTSTRSKGGKQDGHLLMRERNQKPQLIKMSCKNKRLYPNI